MPAPISNYASVTIATGAKTISRAGFGVPVLMGYFPTSITTDRVLTYQGSSGLAEMVTAGFATTDPLYLMASALLQQEPRVQTFKVARMQAHTQVEEITISTIAANDVITLDVTDELGVVHAFSQTAAGVDKTLAASDLAASMNLAMANVTCVAATSTVTCTVDTPGDVFYYYGNEYCTLLDTTPDPGHDTDFAAIEAEDDSWYAVLLDVNSNAIADNAATYFETKRRIFVTQTNDSGVPTVAATTDIASTIQDNNRDRTALFYHHKGDLSEYPACAWVGTCLPSQPGSITWMFKTLSGVTNNAKTTTEITQLDDKNANYLVDVAGLDFTQYGKMIDGSTTTYIDVIRTTDKLQATIEENIILMLVNNAKIGYTDASADLARAEILSAYEEVARNNGVVLEDFRFEALATADQTTANKTARIFAGITFSGTLTGAIHKMVITGTLD